MSRTQGPTRFAVILAFGLVYLFWGSTYLAIDIAVQTIPPALMCGLRFSIAGIVMLAVCAATGRRIWCSARQIALSAVVVLGGGILYLLVHGHQAADYHVFQAEPAAYRGPLRIANAAAHGDALAIIQLGLLLLIATPVARVALSLGIFAREGDRIYVVVTLIVLTVLLSSLAGH